MNRKLLFTLVILFLSLNACGPKRGPDSGRKEPIIQRPTSSTPGTSNGPQGPSVSLLERGIDAFQKGNFNAAEWNIEESLRLSPRYGQAYYWLARVKHSLQENSRALSLLDRAEALLKAQADWIGRIQQLRQTILN